MTTNIIDSLTVALHKEFGDNYRYYFEEIEQNVKKPCFVVGLLNPMVRSTNAIRYIQTSPVVIHYFTDKTTVADVNRDCYSIAERLWNILEYLNLGSGVTTLGYDMSWELVDGVLQFFITYKYPMYKTQELVYMENGELNYAPIPRP